MKHMKTAAAVAGSALALGAAGPAAAADTPVTPASSLNGGLYQVLSSRGSLDVASVEGPLADEVKEQVSDTLGTRQLTSPEGPLGGALKGVPLLEQQSLLGGLPLG